MDIFERVRKSAERRRMEFTERSLEESADFLAELILENVDVITWRNVLGHSKRSKKDRAEAAQMAMKEIARLIRDEVLLQENIAKQKEIDEAQGIPAHELPF